MAHWKTFHENATGNKVPKTGPANFAREFKLFAEMARLMREPSSEI